MHVLIVEDDAALGLFLQRGLKLDGCEVNRVADGDTAVATLASRSFDLVLLDLGLPRKDGIDVLIELRHRCDRTAVLVLTGRSDVEERVRCLDLGADDCLLKPFSLHELRARCKALLRRREKAPDPVLQYGGISLDRISRRVTREGHTVELTAKEFGLLEYLLQKQGECCSRSELLREVWQMSPDAGTNVVDVYINYLRKKLGGEEAIETIRGAGYRLRGVVSGRPIPSVLLLSPMSPAGRIQPAGV